jgi:histidinol dehydrogenase
VFIGPYAPTALGDYAAGANHVLPTGGAARFASALRVDDFRKHLHVVRATPEGSAALSRQAAVVARAEGLVEHAHSLDLRAQL